MDMRVRVRELVYFGMTQKKKMSSSEDLWPSWGWNTRIHEHPHPISRRAKLECLPQE